jgi:uncharacterized protein
MHELNLAGSFIITKQEEEQVQVKSGIIEILPAWKFLLERGS